jgi:hypothetical protein
MYGPRGSLLHAQEQVLGSQCRINHSTETDHPLGGIESSVIVIVRPVECGQYSKLVLQIEEACRRHFLAYGTVQDSRNGSPCGSTSHKIPKGLWCLQLMIR